MIKVAACILLVLVCVIPGFAQNNPRYDAVLAKSFDRFYNNPFPLMELEREDSSILNTASLAGKTIYVDFWFTACSPCIKEIPHSLALQHFFAADTNIVFLNICIENIERKQAWKNMVKAKAMQGINVFYARNRPQKINLLRQLGINDFPTYLLVHQMKIIGHNAPAPSEKGFVHWAIYQASDNIKLSDAYWALVKKSKPSKEYLHNHWAAIDVNPPTP